MRLEARASRMKIVESNIKDQKELVVLTELIQPNLASSLKNKKQQGELEDELEDTLSMMRILTASIGSAAVLLIFAYRFWLNICSRVWAYLQIVFTLAEGKKKCLGNFAY